MLSALQVNYLLQHYNTLYLQQAARGGGNNVGEGDRNHYPLSFSNVFFHNLGFDTLIRLQRHREVLAIPAVLICFHPWTRCAIYAYKQKVNSSIVFAAGFTSSLELINLFFFTKFSPQN